MAQRVKYLPAIPETWVWSLGWEDPLEEEMATHSSTLPWKIAWTEKPGRLQSMGSQRVGHDWVTSLTHTIRVLRFFGIWLPVSLCLSFCPASAPKDLRGCWIFEGSSFSPWMCCITAAQPDSTLPFAWNTFWPGRQWPWWVPCSSQPLGSSTFWYL